MTNNGDVPLTEINLDSGWTKNSAKVGMKNGVVYYTFSDIRHANFGTSDWQRCCQLPSNLMYLAPKTNIVSSGVSMYIDASGIIRVYTVANQVVSQNATISYILGN